MIASTIGDRGQVTLPEEIREDASLEAGDQVEWEVHEGEIRGRKFESEASEILEINDVDPETLLPRIGKITAASIVRSIRADRERLR